MLEYFGDDSKLDMKGILSKQDWVEVPYLNYNV